MSISVILGSMFGDEGKGRVTSELCSQSDSIVVRFSGGHQAGHGVHVDGKSHIFSSFGSGTLQGVPTYWSKYCTFYPNGFKRELDALNKLGIVPTIYIHPLSPVTTPYDIYANRESAAQTKNGTCGLGIGNTFQRQEDFYKLHFSDIFNKTVFDAKLENIKNYYAKKGYSVFCDYTNPSLKKSLEIFNDSIEFLRSNYNRSSNVNIYIGNDDLMRGILTKKINIIFEGSQGILLDQDFGFFPNVTRGNTTSKNALELIKYFNLNIREGVNTHYVTRTYQTRHGNGFMSDERELNLKNNEHETNRFNTHQGQFKTGILDLDLLSYAINSDLTIGLQYPTVSRYSTLAITCIDQTGEVIKAKLNQKEIDINVTNITNHLITDMYVRWDNKYFNSHKTENNI